jgi:uncharacterized protein
MHMPEPRLGSAVDVHTHLGERSAFSEFFLRGIINSVHESLPEADRDPSALALIARLAESSLRDEDGMRMLRAMDDAGIAHAVLLVVDFFYDDDDGEERLALVHEMHRRIVRRFPDRFTVFSGVDPRRGIAAQSILKAAFEQGCRGLKLYPPCGFEVDDDRLWPLYRLCQQHRFPILIHTGPSVPGMLVPTRFATALKRAATAFPEAPFILGHALVGDFDAHLELAASLNNVYLEISGFQTYGFGSDALVGLLQCAVERVPERVLFGSDWPLFNFQVSPRRWLEQLDGQRQRAGIGDAEWALVMQDNARSLLRLPASASDHSEHAPAAQGVHSR